MKPKILFILHTPPPIHGAAMVGRYIKDSSQVSDSFETRYINLGTSRSVDNIGKGDLQKLFRFFGLLWRVVYQMIKFKPDKVYLTLTAKGSGFYKDSVVVIFAKVLGGQMIYHFHNKGVKTGGDKLFNHWLYKIVFNNTDVILLSKHLYSDIEKYVPRERAHVCPNGLPDQFIAEYEKEDYLDQQLVSLLFLSNLIESKGIFTLLNACNRLKEKGLFFCCTYIGGEGDITASELNQRIVELDLKGEVRYAGKKYNEEKKEVFEGSEIFVHPSWNDCFPLVLIEAMQFSLPIVTTPEGGIPDMVEDGKNGFLVTQKDPEALAEKLELLIKNPDLREKMGKAGRQIYEQKFTIDKFEQRLTEILQRVIEKN